MLNCFKINNRDTKNESVNVVLVSLRFADVLKIGALKNFANFTGN